MSNYIKALYNVGELVSHVHDFMPDFFHPQFPSLIQAWIESPRFHAIRNLSANSETVCSGFGMYAEAHNTQTPPMKRMIAGMLHALTVPANRANEAMDLFLSCIGECIDCHAAAGKDPTSFYAFYMAATGLRKQATYDLSSLSCVRTQVFVDRLPNVIDLVSRHYPQAGVAHPSSLLASYNLKDHVNDQLLCTFESCAEKLAKEPDQNFDGLTGLLNAIESTSVYLSETAARRLTQTWQNTLDRAYHMDPALTRSHATLVSTGVRGFLAHPFIRTAASLVSKTYRVPSHPDDRIKMLPSPEPKQ